MENKEFKDEEIEILGWDEFGIKQLAKVTIGKLSTEVYVVPDFDDMSLEELEAYYKKLEDRYDDLQDEEPEDEESDEYSEWEDKFEFIQELLEQVEEVIEEHNSFDDEPTDGGGISIAVDILIGEADDIAPGKKKGASMEEVFDEE